MEQPASPISHMSITWTDAGRKDSPLTLLIRRLEAATSRLEDIASSAEQGSAHLLTPQAVPQASASAPELPSLAQHGSAETPRASESLPPAIVGMDELLDGEVKSFVNASQSLESSLVEEQVR